MTEPKQKKAAPAKQTEEPAPLNLWQKISAVRNLVSTVPKDKTIGFGDNAYKVATHEGVNMMLRPLLVDYGLIDYVSLVSREIIDTGIRVGKRELPLMRYQGRYEYTVGDTDVCKIDDEGAGFQALRIQVEGHGDDTGDKGPGKAMTYAIKTGRSKVFSVTTGEDEEGRQSEEDFVDLRNSPLKPEQLDSLIKKADELFGSDALSKLESLATKLFGVKAAKDIPAEHAAGAMSALEKQAKREIEDDTGTSSTDDDIV